MPDKLTGNPLPHNPLQAAGVLEEIKKLKGNRPWLQFELELLCKVYPDNKVFTEALEKVTTTKAGDEKGITLDCSSVETDKPYGDMLAKQPAKRKTPKQVQAANGKTKPVK